MSAPKRTSHQSTLAALRGHSGIKVELDRLEKAANREICKRPLRYHYNGEVVDALVEDLVAVVGRSDWRPVFERTADHHRRAAKYIRKAVRLSVRVANGSPTYATIPSIVWESTLDAEPERQRIAALPVEDRLFGKGGAIESLQERDRRTVIDLRTTAPDFLKAMLVYAAQCDHEAARLECILKARDRRYDRLGPILNLIRDVQRFTGKPNDAAVARLLADAEDTVGGPKKFSNLQDPVEAIRKIRERHLAS